MKGITLSLSIADRGFVSIQGDIVLLSNIIQTPTGNIWLAGRKFMEQNDAYDFPLRSSLLGILNVSNIERTKCYWKLSEFVKKCILIPNSDGYLCIPLLHSTDRN